MSAQVLPRIIIRNKAIENDKGYTIIAPNTWQQLIERVHTLYHESISDDNKIQDLVFRVENLQDSKLDYHDWPNIIKEGDVIGFQLVTSVKKSVKRKSDTSNEHNIATSSENGSNEFKQTNNMSVSKRTRIKNESSSNSHVCPNQSNVDNHNFERLYQQLPDGKVQVFVKTLKGDTHTIDCNLDETIEQFKLRIWKQINVSTDLQRLIFAGRQLEDGRKLCDYKITRETTLHLVNRLSGGKPVLYLYPVEDTKVDVTLGLQQHWFFTHLYPKPKYSTSNQLQWDVLAKPDGTLTTSITNNNTIESSYLFWEADCNAGVQSMWSIDPTKAICMPSSMAVDYLDKALQHMGLSVREKTEMVSYWMPMLSSKPYVSIQFATPEQVESWAPLHVHPRPSLLKRILLLFEPSINPHPKCKWLPDYTNESSWSCLNQFDLPYSCKNGVVHERQGYFVAVEWGGICLSGGLPNLTM